MMYSQGLGIREIVEQLKEEGVATGSTQVSRDLLAIKERWEADSKLLVEERKERELAALDLVQEEAWRAWLRSQSPSTTKVNKVELQKPWEILPKGIDKKSLPKPEISKGKLKMEPIKETEEQKTSERDGNPAFLQITLQTVEMRLKVLGLLKPADVTINNQNVIGWQQVFEAVQQSPGKPLVVDVAAKVAEIPPPQQEMK